MRENNKLYLAEVLREERIKKGTSQDELARYCGVSKFSVSKREKEFPITKDIIPALTLFANYNI